MSRLVPGAAPAAILAALRTLALGPGLAEFESPEALRTSFLPAAPFRIALEPDVLLIQGGRGVGKSHLFRLLAEGEVTFGRGMGSLRPAFVAGFAKAAAFDPPTRIETGRALRDATPERLGCFWYGLLARQLLRSDIAFDYSGGPSVALRDPAVRVDEWLPAVEADLGGLIHALNALERRLGADGERLYIVYDDLDRIMPTYAGLFAPIRALLAMWHENWRTWNYIRPKIFLRSDLLESRLMGFPDAAKFFAGHRVELSWSRDDLFQMWAKRLANKGEEVREWLKDVGHLRLDRDPTLGWMATGDERAMRRLVSDLVGPYMGANPRKGDSYTWIANHVQDARARLAPRSFLRLFVHAAESASKRSPGGGRPIHPADFHAALEQTSSERLDELVEEDAWIGRLRSVFSGQEVLVEREAMEALMARIDWPDDPSDEAAPPSTDPRDLIDHLVRRGLIEERTDGRFNVPDIYLYGLGMKRKGGIRRSP